MITANKPKLHKADIVDTILDLIIKFTGAFVGVLAYLQVPGINEPWFYKALVAAILGAVISTVFTRYVSKCLNFIENSVIYPIYKKTRKKIAKIFKRQ